MTTSREILSQLFADYRAEWAQQLFASLFVPPPYFSKLETNRPCFLIGGRGTGKTTALKSLRFDAAEARLQGAESAAEALKYFGIYIRINKNRVRAFGGPELSSATWNKAFAHYFNILAATELCHLTDWLLRQTVSSDIVDLSAVARAFDNQEARSPLELKEYLRKEMARLELFVNNGGRTEQPVFSMAETPVRTFAEVLAASGLLENKLLFCCIDEYENLSEEQQSVLNTYVKHSEPPLSYKIGLRRYGLHTRHTIDGDDQIATPDDYLEIDIAEEGFEQFAQQVVEHRLHRARQQGIKLPDDMNTFLPELRFEEEAEKLGCARIADEVRSIMTRECSADLANWAKRKKNTELYFLGYWQEATGKALCELADDWLKNEEQWEVRFKNYGYASLFWLSKGRKGARIRKYYSGARTLLALASGNIRYFLELIDTAIDGYLQSDSSPNSDADIVISPLVQTDAAREVGKRRLDQLEGLSERGVEFKRLVLAVGKVFFELARDPAGRAPEQNLFVLSGSPAAIAQMNEILREAVSHLAIEATPRTKATTQAEMRDEEYRLHPIFCPFFEFSHRRKRRVTFSADTLLKLKTNPSQAINELLDDRTQAEPEELPTQLAMFTAFYQGGRPNG